MESCLNASSAPLVLKKSIQEPVRPLANFHKSVWGDYFLKYALNPDQIDESADEQHEQLKEDLRKKLVVNAIDEKIEEQLKLIDAIQRSGVAYHFETEIADVLNNQLELWNNQVDDDLYMVSLRFRLSRQQGHNVSCVVFEKFKNTDGGFKESLMHDIRGLLSLYESAHMRVHNEDILDEALEFTVAQLEKFVKSSSSVDKVILSQVAHALHIPIRKGLPRIEARRFISFYEQDKSCDETLLKFSKLDFNILQKLHQREAADLTLWWKDLNVSEKIWYARDRLVENYFWGVGVYFEPQYSRARKFFTQNIALISLIDDTYDSYGIYEELACFTDATQRWDVNASEQLPEYMRPIFRELLDVYSEMEEELLKEGISYRVDQYAKQSMIQDVTAYNDEAIWYRDGYVPTFEEYLKVSLVSCGYIMLSTNSFVGMGADVVPKHAFEWVCNNPLMVQAASVINRLADDRVGHELEQERGHVASGVECYIKQHGATKEEVVLEFSNRITNAWKDINQECLLPLPVPMHLLERVLNLARCMNVFYKDVDTYTHSDTQMKDYITSLLIEPIPI